MVLHVAINAKMNTTIAAARATNPITVIGNLSLLNPAGKSPVATPDGMNSCAIIIENANTIISGKNSQRIVNQL